MKIRYNDEDSKNNVKSLFQFVEDMQISVVSLFTFLDLCGVTITPILTAERGIKNIMSKS